ncbi:hypothetical protein BDQ12DRAFT_2389 [Crucibulum laeve]|uniref:Uncharacterized protein n=1 Tax=Crucibulum laeve TaxID=68775 RepID=A0A5C3MGP3_9AGAR|nr:hypothetical protein BDQ12DRAFT_2389 [Crucibulum laeve]
MHCFMPLARSFLSLLSFLPPFFLLPSFGHSRTSFLPNPHSALTRTVSTAHTHHHTYIPTAYHTSRRPPPRLILSHSHDASHRHRLILRFLLPQRLASTTRNYRYSYTTLDYRNTLSPILLVPNLYFAFILLLEPFFFSPLKYMLVQAFC